MTQPIATSAEQPEDEAWRFKGSATAAAATAEEAAIIASYCHLKGGAPPEGSGTLRVFNATDDTVSKYRQLLAIRKAPAPRQTSTGPYAMVPSSMKHLKRVRGCPVVDVLSVPSSGAHTAHWRQPLMPTVGQSDSTWREHIRRSAIESWRELQRDSSSCTHFAPGASSRLTMYDMHSKPPEFFSVQLGNGAHHAAPYADAPYADADAAHPTWSRWDAPPAAAAAFPRPPHPQRLASIPVCLEQL